MPAPLLLVALVCGLLSLVTLAGAAAAFRARRAGAGLLAGLLGVLFLTAAALGAAVSVAARGYQALTREVVAAVVTTERTGPQTFRARVRFPDGVTAVYELAGDELYVDAHVLKWHPAANVLGLHTAYRLDRIAGRYARLQDERGKPRTVYALAEGRPVDLFHLVRRYPVLRPLVDARYGSATFAPTGPRAVYEVRVSTSGLLLRRLGP